MAITVAPSYLAAPFAGDAMEAFDRWALARGMRGRDIYDTLAKVMRYWVSFALTKVPKGDARRIHARLMQTARAYVGSGRNRAKGKAADTYRGTVAAAIVSILDYKGARALKGAAFYRVVGQFDRARQYSANHHRAGFYPALAALPAGGTGKSLATDTRGPRYSHPAGRMEHQLTDDLATILVENFSSQSGDHPFSTRPSTIAGLAADAFMDALEEVFHMVTSFLQRDMEAAAARSGFTVR